MYPGAGSWNRAGRYRMKKYFWQQLYFIEKSSCSNLVTAAAFLIVTLVPQAKTWYDTTVGKIQIKKHITILLQTVRYFTIHPSHLKKYNHLILQNWNLLLETSCFMLHMLIFFFEILIFWKKSHVKRRSNFIFFFARLNSPPHSVQYFFRMALRFLIFSVIEV